MNQPSTTQRTYHGEITPNDLANCLIAAFNQGNLRAQQVGQGNKILVQIATHERARSGGKAALSITLQQVEDGVSVALGNMEWFGVAASLGQTALTTLMNPWNLVNRLDDIAQDITSLNLNTQVWETIEKFAQTAQATKTISERLQSVTCPYCNAANKIGAADCVNCNAPLGEVQPMACAKCGNVMPAKSKFCSNCGAALSI